MKKIWILQSVAALLVLVMLAGCADGQRDITQPSGPAVESTEEENRDGMASDGKNQSGGKNDVWQDQMATLLSDSEEGLLGDIYGDYRVEGGEIAFVCEGTILDGSYNEAVFRGVRTYALAAGVSFSYYVADEYVAESYREVIERAISNQADIVICVGGEFGESMGLLQNVHPQISFLLIDCVPEDAIGNDMEPGVNVHCVCFHEEQSGYLAGYLAVMEGYRNLGFIGGKEVAPVVRYGFGYLQGINDAVEDMGLTDVTVNYWYADTYQPNQEIRDRAARWYSQGTEIIFACGGLLYESVLEAAESEDGLLIGVDVDQSGLSERFVTSAMKDLANAVIISLDDYYASGGRWSGEFAGQMVVYGVEDDCTGIPVIGTEWRFKQVTRDDYYKVYRRIKFGDVSVSDEVDERPKVAFDVNYQ